MSPLPLRQPLRDPLNNDQASVRWLIKSLAHGFVDGLRRNKIAAALAASTLLVSLFAVANSQFDELPRYQEFILPDLSRVEATFLTTMRFAENAPQEWRLYYFLSAHSQVKNIVRKAKSSWPASSLARRHHAEFIRYYELLDEEFAIIRTQMGLYPDLDYLDSWKKRASELKSIRDGWERWASRG